MKVDNGILNLAAFREGTEELMGIVDVTLPTIAQKTDTSSHAGVAGDIESVFIGHVDPMSTSMNFKTVSEAQILLAAPRMHQLEFRAVQQTFNRATGQYDQEGMKYVMHITPKTTNLGNLAPASSASASVEASVFYFAAYKDGRKIIEIDPINFIYVVDGKDWLAETRRLLGK